MLILTNVSQLAAKLITNVSTVMEVLNVSLQHAMDLNVLQVSNVKLLSGNKFASMSMNV